MVTFTNCATVPSQGAGPSDGRDPHCVPATLATLEDGRAGNLVQLFKLLADETRLQILHFLRQTEELNVRTFCRLLRQSQPAVSHHLALLRVAGVLECRRDGKHNFYRLVPQRCEAYLDVVFGAAGNQAHGVRVEDALLTIGRDGQVAAS
jgi:ArsR family transcriptional regulator, arsenate/arsenite/antimonite-responsive transcriptional repressor